MTDTRLVTVAADETVVAVHHAAPTDDWMVFAHGFRSDKEGSYESRCRRAVEEGYNAVRFDFGGCGEADGAFVDSTLGSRITDFRAVVDHFDPPSFVAFGSSFGATVALHAALHDDRVEAVVGRAPVTYDRAFDDLRAVVDAEGEFRYDENHVVDGRFFDDLDAHPFGDVADGLGVPVALFHGAADESVPLRDSIDATAALGTDVLLQTLAGEGQRFSESAESRTRRQVFDWLALVS
jgi:pimeloyl-ACP methyl ester carboxylesterase